MAGLSVCLFGPIQVLVDGNRAASFTYNKARALLAYLAVEADRAHQRDALVGLLWPDLPNDAARTNLRQALADLRQGIGDASASPPYLHVTRETIQFNAGSTHALDVAAFLELTSACTVHPHRALRRCSACAARIEQAMALYRGDFLAELQLVDSAPFEEWATLHRERMRVLALENLDHLVAYHEHRGALGQAGRAALRQIELDPWREESHRTLMRLLALGGQRSVALHQYHVCRRVLAHELDALPDRQTTELYRRIRDGEPIEAVGRQSPNHSTAVLPVPPTPLIGREVELAQVREILSDPAHRLITLHGPGGIGKTRLALAIAAEEAHTFEHSAAFVPLDAVRTGEFLASAILAALNVAMQGQRSPKDQLLAYLREREILLVLDNFEHLASEAELVAELLRHAPRLTLLVTSQIRLALQAEWLFEVHGLSYPPVGHANGLGQFGATQLLLQRIQQMQPAAALTAQDFQAAVTICRLAEGMPLAIELAAGAVGTRSLSEIAAALEHGIGDVLESPWRDVAPRHASVLAVLEHTWQLLTAAERSVFGRLGIFYGGFVAEAAFEVAGATLDVLRALIDKSLLERENSGRYRVHELVRRCAREKLVAAGQADETERRHLTYLARLAEVAEPHLRGEAQAEWLDRLEQEHGNLRAVLTWGASHDIGVAAQLSSRLWRFWQHAGHFVEGRGWLERALAHHASLSTVVRAQVLYALGVLLWHQGFYQRARATFEQSVALWRVAQDRAGLAYGLTMLGMAADYEGDHDRGRVYLAESLALFRTLEDRWGLALALFNTGYADAMAGRRDARVLLEESLTLFRGTGNQWGTALALYGLGLWAYHQEQFATARTHLEQALAMQREVSDNWLVARTLNFLGEVARSVEAYEQAQQYYLESLALFETLGADGRIPIAQHNLGRVACALGDIEAAAQWFRQAIDGFRRSGHTWGITACLEGMAGVLIGRSQLQVATRLLSVTTILHEAAHAIVTPADRLTGEQYLASLRDQLDTASFAAAWCEGMQMTLEEAIDCALNAGEDEAVRTLNPARNGSSQPTPYYAPC